MREAREEVQLTSGLVQVVGLLERVRSPAGFLVQPVVGIVRGEDALGSLVSDPAEVDLMFTLPLSILLIPIIFAWCIVKPMVGAMIIGLLIMISISSGGCLHGY